MTFAIISHVNHYNSQNQYWAYAPYVREMNIWLKYVDKVIVVAPCEKNDKGVIDLAYEHNQIHFKKVKSFDIKTLKAFLNTIIALPTIFVKVFGAMQNANHIHLRCPGNMGLVGAIVQIFFPGKTKTAKYAGNWDPKAKQPFTYKLQRWILSNTFLTRNMQVLVYGEWENQTKNIKPFFTATYNTNDIENVEIQMQILEFQEPIRFIFVGTLSVGKQPLYALKLIEELNKKGMQVSIEFYGEGKQTEILNNYIESNHLNKIAFLRGNQSKETLLSTYKNSDFLLLPSKSEGWPKVVAEAMFWGCLPVALPVSCVPYMMGNGSRGIILEGNLFEDSNQLVKVINNPGLYQKMTFEAQSWARQFTTDKFETEIKKLLKE